MALPKDLPRGAGGTPAPKPAAKKSSSKLTTTSKSAPASTPAPQVSVDDYIRKNYGYLAWALDNPELKAILTQVATPGNPNYGATGNALDGLIKATNWWKTHSDAQKAWADLTYSNPGQAEAQRQKIMAQVQSYANQMGVAISDARMRQIVEDAASGGWDDNQLHGAIGAEFNYAPDGSRPSATVDQLKEIASQYVVPLGDNTMTQWVRDIVSGKQTSDSFKAYVGQQAKTMYNDPNLQSAIDSGQSTRQFLDPQVQKAAQMLGINANTIDFNESKWNQLLQTRNEKGVLQIPDMAQWETTIRTDQRLGYDKSQMGLEDSAKLTQGLGQMMGALK